MKIPATSYEITKGIEKQQLEMLLQNDDVSFLESLQRQDALLKNVSPGFLAGVLDRIETLFECKAKSDDVEPILKILFALLDNPQIVQPKIIYRNRKMFYMVEHLLNVVTLSDNLDHIRLAMQCLPKVYRDVIDISQQYQKYLAGFLPRVIYLLRIFYEHTNLLNPQKVQLTDYFMQQDISQELVLKFTTPTILMDSYEKLQTNIKHSPVPAQAPEEQVLRIPNLQDIVQKNSQINTYEFSRQILQSNKVLAKATEKFCPLWEIVRFRLLFAKKLQENNHDAAQQIVKLHLIQLELYLAIDSFCQTIVEEQTFLDTIFQEKLDYRQLFDTYFNMFTLDLGGDFHHNIIVVLSALMKMETFSEDDECFSYLKSHDEKILKMIQDILTIHALEIEEKRFQILPPQTARHVKFAVTLLAFCASETGMVILSRNNVIAGIVSASLKVLKWGDQDQVNVDVIKETVALIGRLARRDEFQREYNLVDELLSLANKYVQREDHGDALAAQYIQSINELFRDEGGRRANRANAPTIARKIAETSLVRNIKIVGPEITPLCYQTLLLIGHIANEVPMLVGRLIDLGVPSDLCGILMNTRQELTSKHIQAGLSFFYNVSLKEEGYELFNGSAMKFLANQLNNLAGATRDQISVLSLSIVKYMGKIDKAQHEILILLKTSLQAFKVMVMTQKDQVLEMSDPMEAVNAYLKLTQHIQNYCQLLYKLTHQSPPSILEEISKSGIFEIVLDLLCLPQFEQKNDIVRMLKQLSHSDEVNLPKLITEALRDKLAKFEVLMDAPLERLEVLPIDSVETLYQTQNFFMQEGCKKNKFEVVAYLSFFENILEIFKFTHQSPLQTLQPNIGMKCAALYRIVLQKFISAQTQQLIEKSLNERDEGKIKVLLNDALQTKQRLAGFLTNLRIIMVQITKRILVKEDYSNQFLKELICWLSVDMKSEQDLVQNLFKIYWLRDLCNINASQENRRAGEGLQPVHAEFLKQLVQGGFYKEIKHSIFKFFERLSQTNEQDVLLNEVLGQTSVQYAKLCGILYLPRVEVPTKKVGLLEEAHGILFLHVDEIYQTLQMIGTFAIDKKDKSHLQIFQTLFSKASQLLVQNPLELLKQGNQQRGTGLRIFDSLMRQHIYMDAIDPDGEGEQFQQEESEHIIVTLQEMGYTRGQAQACLQNIEFPDVHLAIEWLNSHQEELFQQSMQDTLYQTRDMQEEKQSNKVMGQFEEEPAEFFQKLSAEEFKSKLADKIEAFGLLFLKQILYYEGFEDKVSDFLIKLLTESYNQKKDQSKPQYSKEMVTLLILGMKNLLGQIFPHFNLKIKSQQPNYIIVPDNMHSKSQILKKLNVLLQVLIRVHKIDISENKENLHVRFSLAQEIVRLSYEVMTCKEDNQIAQVTQSMLIAFLFQFLSSHEHEEFLKTHKGCSEDSSTQKIKQSSVKKRTKSEQIPKEKDVDIVHDILTLIVALLKSQQQDSLSSKIMIEILIRAFTLDYSYVKVFILDLKGMELLLKSPLKGNNLTILTKLATSILQDEGLIRAQVEARIKKAIFDLELLSTYGSQDADSAQKHDSKKHQQTASYPMVYGLPYYGLPQRDQVFCIPATHHVIVNLMKNKGYEQLANQVMKEMFDEVHIQDEEKVEKPKPRSWQSSPKKEELEAVEELAARKTQLEKLEQVLKDTKDPSPDRPLMLQLKKDSTLNTFQTVPQTYFQKFHYESDQEPQLQKKSKSQGRDKKPESLPHSEKFPMTNFHHNPESQVFIKLLLQQITKSFFAEIETPTTQSAPFHFELLQVLHIILRRYPVLIPKIARFNCSNSLRLVKNDTIAYGFLKDHPDDKEIPKKVSFLSLLLKLLVPFATQKLCPLVLEMCLDSTILLNHNSQIVSFGTEVRRKVLGEIYNSLEEEIQRVKKQKQRQLLDSHQQTHKFVCYSMLLTYLCQIKPVARMVFKNIQDQTCSFNFPKLYIEAIKLIPIQGYYNFDKVLDFLTESMAILYNLGIYNLFQKPRGYLEGPTKGASDPSNAIKKYLENAPGALSIEDINTQMVPNKSILYKESKTIFKNWPLPPLSFQANIVAQEQNWRDDHDLDQFARLVRMRAGLRLPPGQQEAYRGRRVHRIEIYDDLVNIPFVNVNGIIEEDSGDDEIALEDDVGTGNQDMSQMSQSISSSSSSSGTPSQEEEDTTSWVTSDSANSQSHQVPQVMEQQSDDWTDDEDPDDIDNAHENDMDDEDDDDEDDDQDDDDDDQDEDPDDDDGDNHEAHDDMMLEEGQDEDDEEDMFDQEADDDEGLEIEEENLAHNAEQVTHPQRGLSSIKQDLFKNDDSNLLKQLKALTRMQSVGTANEFQLVLEDLSQVIKLIYDVSVETIDTGTTDDEKFWNHTTHFFRKIKDYEDELDKPFNGWWVDLVQQNVTQVIPETNNVRLQQQQLQQQGAPINEHDPLNDFHNHLMRAMTRGRDLVDVLGARAGDRDARLGPQYQPPQFLASSIFTQQHAQRLQRGNLEEPQDFQEISQQFQQQQQQSQQQQRQQTVRVPLLRQNAQLQAAQQQAAQQQQASQQSMPDIYPPMSDIYSIHLQQQQQQQQIQQDIQQDQTQQRQQLPQQRTEPIQPIQPQSMPPMQPIQPIHDLTSQMLQVDWSNLNLQGPIQNEIQEEIQPSFGQQIIEQVQQLQSQAPMMNESSMQQQVSHHEEIRQQFPKSTLILDRMGMNFEILQVNDVDLLTFEDLPEEFQLDILQGFGAPPQQQRQQQQTIDPAFLSQLPPELQFELMQPLPEPQQQGLDTITFIQTLTPDLREEVLLTLGNEILDQLPADLRAEAMEIRMRANQRAMHRLEEQQIHEQIRREVQRDPGVNNRGRPNNLQQQQQQQQQQQVQPLNQKTLRDLKEHFLKDKHLLAKLGNLDDEFIEALLSFLYVESHSFVYFPINLLASLQSNPILESKILDALFYILKQQLQLQEQKVAVGLREDQFPLSFIVQRYTILHDQQKTYENVSLKILYLFSKLPQNSIQYFFDSGSKKQLQSIQKLAASTNKPDFQSQVQLIPLLQLIHLLPQQAESHMHLQLLVAALYNLTRKNLKVLAVRNDRTTEPLYQVKLDQSSIRCICQVLLSTGVQQKTIKQLSLIINHLCVDSQNLHLFIQEIRSVITDVTKAINEVFQRTLNTLESNRAPNISRQLEQDIQGERILINIFQFVRELFEMEQNRQNVKDAQKQEAQKDLKKDKEGEQKIDEEKVVVPVETDVTLENIRKSFQELITDESLYRLWLNTTSVLQILGTISQDLGRVHFKVAPILESFFIIYQILNPQQDKKKSQLPQLKNSKSSQPQMRIASMQNIQDEKIVDENSLLKVDLNRSGSNFSPDDMFNMICEKGKVVLNLMIKEKLSDTKGGQARWDNSKKTILSEPLGIIFLKQPKIVDFENKQKYFKQELKQLKLQNRHYAGTISLRIRRKDIFIDSFHHFSKKRTEELRGKLNIEFSGEEGVDAGGVTREWFMVLSREIFNPGYALFQSSLNGQMFQPSTKSFVNPDHLRFFKFIGRIVGKALYDGYLLDSYFTRSFYKHMLGQSLTFHDMEDIDLDEYNSMKKLLENDVTHWGLNWIYNVETFGIQEERELIPGGKNMPVTQENKAEYVQTYCYQKMAKDIKEQTEAFLSGFYELIPQNLVSIFEWKEMELMLCGLPDIDLEDLKENVEYHNYTNESKIIKWLWELLESYDKSKRASFLQFVTGTSKVPLGGFKDLRGMSGSQKLQIHKKPYYNFELPTSHTCFNQLDLPDYPTREVLKQKLELAILEGKEGFGFA